MQFFNDVICPISNIRIDNNVSRLTVFLNAVLLAAFVLTSFPLLIALVALDYGIRVLWDAKYSPMKWLATQIGAAINMPQKMVDKAPKMFAARVGFLFAFVATLSYFAISPLGGVIVAAVLLVFTVLDSVFNFCVGCITYSFGVLPFYRMMGIRE